jgi:hypothetical protein
MKKYSSIIQIYRLINMLLTSDTSSLQTETSRFLDKLVTIYQIPPSHNPEDYKNVQRLETLKPYITGLQVGFQVPAMQTLSLFCSVCASVIFNLPLFAVK